MSPTQAFNTIIHKRIQNLKKRAGWLQKEEKVDTQNIKNERAITRINRLK